MSRDVQKSKVYHAEWVFETMLEEALENPQVIIGGSTLVLPPQAKFSSPETIQVYVDRVLSHPGVIDQWGRSTVRVRKRKGNKYSHYQGGVIAIPDDERHLREYTVLHELAHHFTWLGGHGPEFTFTLLTLVGIVMGPQAELALRILFHDGGVKAA